MALGNSQLEIVTNAVVAVVNQAKLAHTLQCAVTALAGQESILRLALESAKCRAQDREAFEKLIEYQQSLGPWAVEVQQDENHAINLPAAINLWVTFEASIEDLCVSVIMSDESSVSRLRAVNPKLPETRIASEDAARGAYEKTLLRLKKSGLVGALFSIISTLGIDTQLPNTTIDRLNELNYIRNCALHRGGVVEARKSIEAPTLALAVGSNIIVSNEYFLRYYDAVGNALAAIHEFLKQEG